MTDDILTRAKAAGVLFRVSEDRTLDGRTLQIGGQEVINFGSCSYLGLEMDQRLKAGAMEAIQRYGTQFSASRAYISLPLYDELERAFEEIFQLPTLVGPTTTLVHAGALPVLIESGDVVLLDQQVHHSVHQGMNHVRANGVPVEIVRHNRVDLLDARIQALAKKYRRVWYMADGVYSMYGDVAPMASLVGLLERHEALNLYIDDAHGMSWTGDRGQGYALGQVPHHPRLFVATSLAKAFGVGGGVLILPDAEIARKLRTVGSSFIFSGPIQPANLGAALASARLHLDGSLKELQAGLASRIELCNRLCRDYGLPLVSPAAVPIRFIGAGLSEVVFKVVSRLLARGFYTNSATYPAVPMTRAGIRFTLTLHQTHADIAALIGALAEELPRALAEEGSSIEAAYATFKLPDLRVLKRDRAIPTEITLTVKQAATLQHETTIENIDPTEWDGLLGTQGTFTWAGMRSLEAAFRHQEQRQQCWRFHYFISRDGAGKPVLATFFTEALWKTDMLASAAVSQAAEAGRALDAEHLTAWTLSMGSLLTEGQHLYLDRSADWRPALTELLRYVERLRADCSAESLVLRDIAHSDAELQDFLKTQGYADLPMFDSYKLVIKGQDEATYMANLSKDNRRSLRKKVMRFDDHFDLSVWRQGGQMPNEAQLAQLYDMYLEVVKRNRELNCFDLPKDLFGKLLEHPCWEILVLRLKSEYGGDPAGAPAAFTVCFRGGGSYVPHICGLDYRFVESHGAYRQICRQPILRALKEGFDRVYMGYGAPVEKLRLGCTPSPGRVFIKMDDDFQWAVLRQSMHDANPA